MFQATVRSVSPVPAGMVRDETLLDLLLYRFVKPIADMIHDQFSVLIQSDICSIGSIGGIHPDTCTVADISDKTFRVPCS